MIIRQKIYVAILVTILSSGFLKSFAQVKKGMWMLETSLGNLNYVNSSNEGRWSNNYTKEESIQIGIYPKAGYLLTDNLMLGSSLNFQYSSNSSENRFKYTASYVSGEGVSFNAGLGPFLRYYLPGKDRNRFYIQGGFDYDLILKNNYISTSFDDNEVEIFHTKYLVTGYSYKASAIIGFNHFFNDAVAFNTTLGYQYESRYSRTSTQISGISIEQPLIEFTTKYNRLIWNAGISIFLTCRKENVK